MPDFPYRIKPKKNVFPLCNCRKEEVFASLASWPNLYVKVKKSPLESCIPNVSWFGFIVFKAEYH